MSEVGYQESSSPGEIKVSRPTKVEPNDLEPSLLNLRAALDELKEDDNSPEKELEELKVLLAEANARADAAETKASQLEESLTRANEEAKKKNEEIERLKSLVNTDELTQILNRRGFTEAAFRALAQTERGLTSMLYIRLDIDRFKEINDKWGHEWGDKVLQYLADKLKSQAREGDIIGRFGGEEFDLILPMKPNADSTDISSAINRYFDAIQEIFKDQHAPGEFPENPISLTASFGAVLINAGEKNLIVENINKDNNQITREINKDIKEEVDSNLYKAKEGGRQATVVTVFRAQTETPPASPTI